MGSTFGRLLRLTTFGESHGEAVGCVLENVPAGLELTEADIQPQLDRRRPGQSNIATPRKEADIIKILSGTFEGKTIGSPISMVVYNTNAKEKDYSDFANVFRPSHADYTYQEKYGYRSYRGGARASARSTVGVVAAGAIASKILQEKMNAKICAFVSQVYDLRLNTEFELPAIDILKKEIEKNPVRTPDQQLAILIEKQIQKARQAGESLGGIIEAHAQNIIPGLGDPVFDRLDALMAQAMLAIPATKGVEIGSGFSCATMMGSEHNDIFESIKGKVHTKTNYSGGIQGGISNGEPITMRIAFKPTATISKEQPSIDDKGNEIMLKVKGRHDPCVLPRAVPIVEAFMALVLADQFLINLASDYTKIPQF